MTAHTWPCQPIESKCCFFGGCSVFRVLLYQAGLHLGASLLRGLGSPIQRGVGNDNARLFLSALPPLFRIVHYNPTSTKHFSFSVGSVPRALQPQLGILRYFTSYMEQHLMKVCVCGLQWGHLRGTHAPLLPSDPPLLVMGEGWPKQR